MTPDIEWLLAAAIIFLGGFVQASIGFGLAVVAAPLLYMVKPELVPGALILQGLLISTANTWRFRRAFKLDGITIALIARVPGSALGAWLLLSVSHRALEIFIGTTVLLAVLLSQLQWRIPVNRISLFSAGFLSGIFGTTAAVGGPPMALLLQHQQANALRANLSVFFIFSCLISLSALLLSGATSIAQLSQGIYLFVPLLAGFWLAGYTNRWLKRSWLRYGVLLLCSSAGILLLIS